MAVKLRAVALDTSPDHCVESVLRCGGLLESSLGLALLAIGSFVCVFTLSWLGD